MTCHIEYDVSNYKEAFGVMVMCSCAVSGGGLCPYIGHSYVQMQMYPLRQKITCNVTRKPKHNVGSVGYSPTLSQYMGSIQIPPVFVHFSYSPHITLPIRLISNSLDTKTIYPQLLNTSTHIKDTLGIGP